MWNRLRFIRFLQVSQIFQRRKSDANKQDFENKLNLTCQAQSTPKTIGIFTKLFSTSGPNLVTLAWRGDELSHGQAQNGVNFDFEVKFDLEGQNISPPKTIGILTEVFYTYGSNLAILARTGDELSRGQACGYSTQRRTHRQTDAGNNNTRRPKLASGNKRNFVKTVPGKLQNLCVFSKTSPVSLFRFHCTILKPLWFLNNSNLILKSANPWRAL